MQTPILKSNVPATGIAASRKYLLFKKLDEKPQSCLTYIISLHDAKPDAGPDSIVKTLPRCYSSIRIIPESERRGSLYGAVSYVSYHIVRIGVEFALADFCYPKNVFDAPRLGYYIESVALHNLLKKDNITLFVGARQTADPSRVRQLEHVGIKFEKETDWMRGILSGGSVPIKIAPALRNFGKGIKKACDEFRQQKILEESPA